MTLSPGPRVQRCIRARVIFLAHRAARSSYARWHFSRSLWPDSRSRLSPARNRLDAQRLPIGSLSGDTYKSLTRAASSVKIPEPVAASELPRGSGSTQMARSIFAQTWALSVTVAPRDVFRLPTPADSRTSRLCDVLHRGNRRHVLALVVCLRPALLLGVRTLTLVRQSTFDGRTCRTCGLPRSWHD